MIILKRFHPKQELGGIIFRMDKAEDGDIIDSVHKFLKNDSQTKFTQYMTLTTDEGHERDWMAIVRAINALNASFKMPLILKLIWKDGIELDVPIQ